MGEGAASLVLEEYEHAVARDAHIHCEVAGYSLNNNAFHMTRSSPKGGVMRARYDQCPGIGEGTSRID
jgi:minimal PKS ketosynthase (KS/KS alpha)